MLHEILSMNLKRTIATYSLLASVLLGGLVAPLSHFTFMAFSDAYQHAPGGSEHHVMAAMADGTSAKALDVPQDDGHFECPYAAFFLAQASGLTPDVAGLSITFEGTCLPPFADDVRIGSQTSPSSARAPPSIQA